MTGSELLSHTYMGYILIGILAFGLGVTLTLGCLHFVKMRNLHTEKKDDAL